MKSLPETIIEHSRLLPEGGVLAPKEFLHLASRAAVDQAFSRLAKGGELMRISRGLYVAPVAGRFGKRAPATEKVISAIASKSHQVIALSGARAANTLGLTQHVSIREVFVTSGRPRILQLGKAQVRIEHAPQWQVTLGATIAGDAVRALAWLGEIHVQEAVAKLRACLSSSDWQILKSHRSSLPPWMAEAIGREAAFA
ncbi:hypothetical protein KZ843_09775 [Pseudomonas aeruginosa]|nr:DUF6088 family protein [Pseudomonas aeruginosa]MBW6123172.1 hypothetical protein [Pseudomonas aeruginosa]